MNHIGFIFHDCRSCKRSGFSAKSSLSRTVMSSFQTGFSHFSSIMVAGSDHVLIISVITIFACGHAKDQSAIRQRKSAYCSCVNLTCSNPTCVSLSQRATGQTNRFAVSCASAHHATTLSKN